MDLNQIRGDEMKPFQIYRNLIEIRIEMDNDIGEAKQKMTNLIKELESVFNKEL